jgi:heme/copper-type cytochrome/quinol oxidase subunit 2
MEISNFWYYTIMIVVILHVLIAFAYLMYKLSPKKKDKNDNE